MNIDTEFIRLFESKAEHGISLKGLLRYLDCELDFPTSFKLFEDILYRRHYEYSYLTYGMSFPWMKVKNTAPMNDKSSVDCRSLLNEPLKRRMLSTGGGSNGRS